MSKKLVALNQFGQIAYEQSGYDINSFNPKSFPDGVFPIVVDDTLPSVSDVRTVFLEGGETGSFPVLISPVTEQILSGSVVGAFSMNEQVFQSQYIPVIVNNLTLSGATARQYDPTVGTIGASGAELGNRSIEFKGSYLDTDTKAAGLQLPSFSTTGVSYFLISGFVYLQTTPGSAYDPILITRSGDGVSSTTNDSFRLEYDNSGKQLQFHFATSNTSAAGMPYVLNICPTDGVTLNQWHQFAVAYSNQGSSACASSYWNGNRYAQYTGITGNLKNSTASFMLGSGVSGDRPLKGWLEHIMVSMGGVTAALREFNHGATAPIDPEAQYAGDYTVYAITMNGPLGSSLFPCANTKRIVSTVSYVSPLDQKIGVSNVNRENTSVHGPTLFTGVNGGHTGSSSSSNVGYVFGYDSGACMIVSSVQPTFTALSDGQKIKGSLIDHTIAYLTGSTAMRGTCASPGDFPMLFGGSAGSFSGRTFSFLPVTSNVSLLRSVYDNIIVGGSTGPYYLSDFEGNIYTFSTGGVKNLYTDVVNYQSNAFLQGTSAKNAVSGAATTSALLELNGISDAGIVSKLAPSIQKNGFLYLTGKARATKTTNVPEFQATLADGDITPIGET